MRLSFPNGEHPDVLLEDGELTIGSAAGNRVLVPGSGLAPRHVNVRVDAQRGIVMNVLDAAANAHVNARPVKEMAFLRLGDVVSLERLQMLVKPDRDALIETKVPADSRPLTDPAQRTGASRVVLRGISGAYAGRSMNLCDPLRIGRSNEVEISLDDPDVPDHLATLELHGERVLLRNVAGAEGVVVNGVAVRDAVLHPGDQMAFDGHRFVLEAPGLPQRGSAAASAAPGAAAGTTQTLQAVRTSDASDADGKPKLAPRTTPRPPSSQSPTGQTPAVKVTDELDDSRFSYGWLILVAAAIGAGLAALLVYAPR